MQSFLRSMAITRVLGLFAIWGGAQSSTLRAKASQAPSKEGVMIHKSRSAGSRIGAMFASLALMQGCSLEPDTGDTSSAPLNGENVARESDGSSSADSSQQGTADSHSLTGEEFPDLESDDASGLQFSRPGQSAVDIDTESGEVSVHIELRQGPRRPAEWRGDPANEGEFEGDVLLSDSQGRVMLVEVGGHQPVDPTWPARMAAEHGRVDPTLRKQELALAITAAKQAALSPQLNAEEKILAQGLVVSAGATLAEFDTGKEALRDAESSSWHHWHPFHDHDQAGEDHSARQKSALAGPYVHQVYIRSASCCWSFGIHSATRLRIFDSAATLLADYKTRNHGRLVDDASMATVSGCPKSFSPRSNMVPPYQPYVTTDLDGTYNMAGGCNTPNGTTNGTHTCNDDSYAQYTNVKNNATSAYSICSDNILTSVAPTCN